MHWYGGSIAEAVNLSKQKNAIFVVFIEGDNELSTEMATTIDDSAVVKRLGDQTNFLAIKLKSGTTNYTHFAQIYQFVPVPSLFFIGRNGTPLEVVCAGVQPANLATRIDRILAEHHTEKPSVQPSTSSQDIREQTSNLLLSEAAAERPPVETSQQAEATPKETPEESSEPAAKMQKVEHHESKSGQHYEVVCDGDVCVRKPTSKPDEAGPSQRIPAPVQPSLPEPEPMQTESSVSVEEKIERAKELIEAKRREQAAKEKELEIQKEMERRATGQGVAELKRWQADQEMKQIQEERRREKMENDMARQRILEQIAQDRAERRARDFAPVAPPAPPVAPVARGAGAATSGDTMRARIQFKLPDGSSHSAQFDADGKLSDVTRYIADNLQLSTSQFSLWTAFPRRELTEPDASLRELQLAPSAALLVQTRRSAPPVERTTSVANLIVAAKDDNGIGPVDRTTSVAHLIAFFTQFFTSFILEPTQQFYTWLRSRLFPPNAPPRGPSGSPRPSPPPPGLRKRGNIHRLPGDHPADDDNNTWNDDVQFRLSLSGPRAQKWLKMQPEEHARREYSRYHHHPSVLSVAFSAVTFQSPGSATFISNDRILPLEDVRTNA